MSERQRDWENLQLNNSALALFAVLDQVVDRADLSGRLLGSAWSLGEDYWGVELLTTTRGWVIQVFVEVGVGVTVRRWVEEKGRVQPGQKNQLESSISVYPKYVASNPVFDDLDSCGLVSRMELNEVAGTLSEVARILVLKSEL